MFAKSALAATAFFALTAAFLPGQQATANTQVGVGIGFGYGYGDYNNDDYDEIGYGNVSCWKGKEIVRWQGFKNVVPYDCSGPVYKYKAWKHGEPYRVRVNWRGYVVSIKPL